ncbi:membrane-associated protein, putative [Bodo saltans]|uniref:Membrane-associated protein, putative n=1 Tax=Bodo saltans TaxID=75058 RepID=A0A0S4IXS2_BODSA|nr:membrane-associated protein, putative [Bodo saltans]|eukprot:CUG09421.1 membrane-associated protein, putative [Bodo saltans]
MDVVSVVVMGVLGLLSEALSMSGSTMEASASVGTAASILSLLFLVLAIVNRVTISIATSGVANSLATVRKRSNNNNISDVRPFHQKVKKVSLQVLIELICRQRTAATNEKALVVFECDPSQF